MISMILIDNDLIWLVFHDTYIYTLFDSSLTSISSKLNSRIFLRNSENISKKVRPPVTMVVFRNFQWGAEKRNTTLPGDLRSIGQWLTIGGHGVLVGHLWVGLNG